jgi:hypothetical protein
MFDCLLDVPGCETRWHRQGFAPTLAPVLHRLGLHGKMQPLAADFDAGERRGHRLATAD